MALPFTVLSVSAMAEDPKSVLILSDFNGRDYAVHRVARADVAARTAMGYLGSLDDKEAKLAAACAANDGYAYGGQYFPHGADDYAALSAAIRAFRARAGEV